MKVTMNWSNRQYFTKKIKEEALGMGFDLIGITSAEDIYDYKYYKSWLSNHYQGEMGYMERLPVRQGVRQLFPSAESVISCGVNYYAEEPDDTPEGIISNYARNKDYHIILMKMLKKLNIYIKDLIPESETRICVDTAPILEKAYAQRAGIGWIGKNTCLISRHFGSWVFLGEIITNIPLEIDKAAQNYCGQCTKCLEICPTGAFQGEYQLNASKCISYLTIELKNQIPEVLRDNVGKHIFGCDLCQSVCPWNKRPLVTSINEFHPRSEIITRDLSDWLSITEEDFKTIFQQNPVKRTKWKGFLRNAITVAGNSKDKKYLHSLKELLNLNDPLLNEHILWAVTKINN